MIIGGSASRKNAETRAVVTLECKSTELEFLIQVTKFRAGEERPAEAGPRGFGARGVPRPGDSTFPSSPTRRELAEEGRRRGALHVVGRTRVSEPIGVGDALL